MKWLFPAKTFLVGEYIALQGGPAIVLTTTPCFEVSLTNTPGLHGIHPESPAGQWWLKQNIHTQGLSWYDPYQGKGGLGASGAQFLGAYMASQFLLLGEKQTSHFSVTPQVLSAKSIAPVNKPQDVDHYQQILNHYLQIAGKQGRTSPSGYDVLAQCVKGCALIHQQQAVYQSTAWPFADLAFILLRTGTKVPTHEHLSTFDLQEQLTDLTLTASMAYHAWKMADSAQLIAAVRTYHEQLKNRHWVVDKTLKHIETLDTWLKPLAIKGCGAMGADVILLLLLPPDLKTTCEKLTMAGWQVLATSLDVAY